MPGDNASTAHRAPITWPRLFCESAYILVEAAPAAFHLRRNIENGFVAHNILHYNLYESGVRNFAFFCRRRRGIAG
jgi:hypothetical protein